MKSRPQNPEFRYNPENFHPCNFGRGPYEEHLCKMFLNLGQ